MPWRRACSRPTLIMLAEVSTAITLVARWESKQSKGTLSGARSAMTMGRQEAQKSFGQAFHDFPGT